QLLSDIAGNIFGMSEIRKLKLLDFELPRAYVRGFRGPAFGIEGVRKIIGTEKSKRPHVGTIVKPKVGLNPQETAEVAYDAWAGGIDFVKDDENLTNQKFCPFEERVMRVMEARDKAQSETGEKKMYAANITAETNEMLRRAEFVGEHGGNCIMVDIITAGFAGLQSVREADFGMVIHAHRAMYAALARDERMGISMLALGKLARLAGVDQLHIGAIFGKMHGEAKEVLDIKDAIERGWFGMKPVFSVASGGLSPLEVANVIRTMGKNVIIQAGGGVHGHPDGTRAGARAMRQAVDAAVKGINIREHAKTHRELARALEKWGGKKSKYYAD
ncbi:MAG: RuBisCO large subunit C-terminal-like domain-containing protein, partial [Candidatus Micrarchaeota archaeon]